MSKELTREQIERAAILASLAPTKQVDEVPEGWMTPLQVSEKTGKSLSWVSTLLTQAVRDGRWEVKKFTIENGQRGVYPVPHYRMVT